MVKPATTSSNTPIKQRDRAREPSSCSPASSSPDSYHYSTKLRCIPPGGRTSPSPSPSPSPSQSQSQFQSQPQSPTTRGRTTTPPPTASPAASCRLTSLTIINNDNDNNGNSAPHDSAATATADPSKPPAPAAPTSPTPPHAAALAYRFPPQTPPPRPRNPLAKQKAFTEPSPVHGAAARPTTQEQLEALRGRGVGGLFEAFERVGRRKGHVEDEGGDVEKEGEREDVLEQDDDEGGESTSTTSMHVATNTNTAVSSSCSSSADHPNTTDQAHASNPIDESDFSAQALLAHRTHAAAAYEAARLARCAAPDDLAVKAAYVEARAAYDAARRAYANAVMDEEEMMEAAARNARKEKEKQKEKDRKEEEEDEGKDDRKGKGKGKGKGMDKGKRKEMMLRQGDEDGGGEGEGQATVQQPPSPSPSPTREKQKQKQRGRIASPLERLERSVRRMKANRAI